MSRSCKAAAVICLLLCFVIAVSPVVNAASWIALIPAEHISDTYYTGNYRHVVYDFKRPALINYKWGTAQGSGMASVSLVPPVNYSNSLTFTVFPLGITASSGPPLAAMPSGTMAIDVSDFKPSAALNVYSSLAFMLGINYYSDDFNLNERISIGVDWFFHGYYGTGGYAGTALRTQASYNYTLQDVPGDSAYLVEFPFSFSMPFDEIGSNVSYVIPVCNVTLTIKEDPADLYWAYIKMKCSDFTFTARTDMLLQDSLTMQAIESELVNMNDKLDQTNDKLDDLINQPQNEKEEATQEGDKFVAQLTGAIPGDNQGFVSSINQLASSMSYEGTDAKLKLPALSLPAIPGVMKSYTLTEPQDIDFGFWIQKIPPKILTLVQVLGTLGLVVYSFKELYGMISYAMTLKGGKSDV